MRDRPVGQVKARPGMDQQQENLASYEETLEMRLEALKQKVGFGV